MSNNQNRSGKEDGLILIPFLHDMTDPRPGEVEDFSTPPSLTRIFKTAHNTWGAMADRRKFAELLHRCGPSKKFHGPPSLHTEQCPCDGSSTWRRHRRYSGRAHAGTERARSIALADDGQNESRSRGWRVRNCVVWSGFRTGRPAKEGLVPPRHTRQTWLQAGAVRHLEDSSESIHPPLVILCGC